MSGTVWVIGGVVVVVTVAVSVIVYFARRQDELEVADEQADTGPEIAENVDFLHADGPEVAALAWSPDGARLASGGADGRVVLWEVSSRSRRWEADLGASSGERIRDLGFSPQGELLSVATDSRLVFVDVGSGEVRSEAPEVTGPRRLQHSRNGRFVATGTDSGGNAHLVQPDSGDIHRTYAVGGRAVHGVDMSADSRSLLAAGENTVLRIWNVKRDRKSYDWFNPTHAFHVPGGDGRGPVEAAAFAGSGQRAVVAGGLGADRSLSGGMLHIVDLEAEETVGQRSSDRPVTCMAVDADGTRVAYPAAGHLDREVIEVVDLQTGETLAATAHEVGTLRSMAYDPAAERLACGADDGRIYLWNSTASGTLSGGPNDHVQADCEVGDLVEGTGPHREFSVPRAPWLRSNVKVVEPSLYDLYEARERLAGPGERPDTLGRLAALRLAWIREESEALQGQLDGLSVSSAGPTVSTDGVGQISGSGSMDIGALSEKKEKLEQQVSGGAGGRAKRVRQMTRRLQAFRDERTPLQQIVLRTPRLMAALSRQTFRATSLGRLASLLIFLMSRFEGGRLDSLQEDGPSLEPSIDADNVTDEERREAIDVLTGVKQFLEERRSHYAEWSERFIEDVGGRIQALEDFQESAREGWENAASSLSDVDEAATAHGRFREVTERKREVYLWFYRALVSAIESGVHELEMLGQENEAEETGEEEADNPFAASELKEEEDAFMALPWEEVPEELRADEAWATLQRKGDLPDALRPGELSSQFRSMAARIVGAEEGRKLVQTAAGIPSMEGLLAGFGQRVSPKLLEGEGAVAERLADEGIDLEPLPDAEVDALKKFDRAATEFLDLRRHAAGI